MESREMALEAVAAGVGDLPAMPATVAEVMRVTEDPAATVQQISECIEHDPGLVAKILTVSNSPFFGMRQHVATLKLALVVLGVREVRNIVLGISVFEAFGETGASPAWLRDLWDHSVLVGALSKHLGAALALGLQGEDFVAGLLHDIGKVVLYKEFGPKYHAILEASGSGHSAELCAQERDKLGFDHADAAAALAAHWGLPTTLGDSLWCHHAVSDDRPLGEAAEPRLAALVRIANLAAHDDFESGDGTSCASCLAEKAWETLESPKAPKDAGARFQLLSGFRDELGEAPGLSFE